MYEPPTPTGADIEILELTPDGVDPSSLPCIKPSRVLINGVDVGLILKDSIVIDPGNRPDRTTKVTLTLQPRSVTIRAV